MTPHKDERQRGVVIVLVAISLVAILGMAALAIDIGRLCIAAQVAQNVADAATMGGGQELPDYAAAESEALTIVGANNESGGGFQAVCEGNDVSFWGPGETIPDFGPLGSAAWGIQVTAHVPIQYTFARVLGYNGTTATRSCTVVRMPVGGVPIAPMWISYGTDYQYGQEQQLLMADGPHVAGIPGSFGWLQPPSGENDTFAQLLSGYNLSQEQLTSNYVTIDESVYANTGVSVGQWTKALDSAPDGLARLERATSDPWTYDTFDDFHSNNPRLIIIPMVEYLGGTGSNAEFQIHKFGAFWLESIDTQGQPRKITGRFIEYTIPGAGGDPLSPETGLWTVKVVQ